MLRCEDLLETKNINTYYEFLFAMALAAECGRRGTSLDMSKMRINNSNLLSPDDIAYMHYLKDIGSIYDGTENSKKYDRGSSRDTAEGEVLYYFDVNAVTELGDTLFDEKEDGYYWSTDYAFNSYKSFIKGVLKRRTVSNTLLHLTAHMLICFKLNEKVRKPLKFYFKNYEVVTMHIYLILIACSRTLKPLKDIIDISFDKNYIDNLGDIDFGILYDTSRHANRGKKLSCSEKFDIFRSYGFEKGSIAVLYERGRLRENNKVGVILRASIIRIDDFNEDVNTRAGWSVTKFSVNKTKEELEDDYYGIDEEYRSTFSDLLNPTIGKSSSTLGFENTGIGVFFSDEEYLIMPIEREEKVFKKVTIDGKLATIELDDVESVYWILNEYGVDFDKDMYKKFYNQGKPLMWDMYDCTPLKRKETSNYIG